ncbi:hypothetical protein PIB30_024635 [Stylosanthes scabra]|uniref:BHLH domain-containing protein n=1 Tax=Stylosanthes scabra TaxID=79078 RepID=A0ABU6WAY0_9FABA|nr:hypothetical protein [Stylosanthes scabra]
MCLPDAERDMALEAVFYSNTQQPSDPSSLFPSYGIFNNNKDLFNYNNNEHDDEHQSIITGLDYLLSPPLPPPPIPPQCSEETTTIDTTTTTTHQTNLDNTSSCNNCCVERPKRRRAKTRKNKEEIENQRMTHIAVERNRRKQMNDYLSLLRSLMPDSYVQRGDQASIIGGAINYVKVLEQKLQFLAAHKEIRDDEEVLIVADGGSTTDTNNSSNGGMPFSEFFAFPQVTGNADIEVTMVESHANLKIRSKKKPKQLLKMVSNLQAMRLTILHLNVTTTNDVVLYSLSVKVEDDCKLGSVDEIATAVCQMMENIQQESMLIN